MRRTLVTAVTATLLVGGGAVHLASPAQAAVAAAPACSTNGSWQAGELNIYFFDVEQGDSQLIVGPTGRTMLIDLGERSWNAYHTTMAMRVAEEIRAICGIASGPVHLDYVMASHHHLDHVGYAGNPHDDGNIGNGFWQLLHPDHQAFTVGTVIDRDAGDWVDTNGDGTCEVGTSAEPSDEVVWHNAGTTSQTTRRLICWLYGPDGQRDRLHIEGRVLRLTNDDPWPSFDLGPGVTAEVLQANAKGVMQADGVTPVPGDHTTAAYPPSENDYSIALKVQYGQYRYATAGDLDGEYSISGFGYSYNDVEASVAEEFGDVDTMRVNHHGSGHSTSSYYTEVLAPESAVISCGNNSYGHPANRVLDELRTVVNGLGVGADIYLTNNPCAIDDRSGDPIDYTGVLNTEGDIALHTTGGGTGYTIHYDAGSNSYPAGLPPVDGGPTPTGEVLISELRLRGPGGANDEFVELRNTGTGSADISGWRLQGCAATSGAATNRATIPAGTVLPPGGYYLIARDTHYTGAATADLTFSAAIADEGGVRLVTASGGYVDGVGSAAPASSECREGAGLTFPTGDADVSFHRDGAGSVDTDDNAADFLGPAASQPTSSLGQAS
ncbi:lamin tail domain-containing protein [Natronosporangium hydrolyticum]|uniref:Lamin tail domain-containing protein n=1 Tax=Natronosporangium hydrolyticum TaxID=2811111 RepID=A0A895YEQ9_9ACTN|nr:lamin tail domain-containing protein [Natronosporangium hydrolyticum]QSB14632.1 lamin tail domain-containing protein [Natronosporangium hydrolyticum]